MRRHPVDEYLRAHDPVPRPQPAPARAAGSVAPRAARLRPRLAAGLALAGAVVVAVAFMPGRATNVGDAGASFLSPEAAVAAAAEDLSRDGILHWTLSADSGVGGAGASTSAPGAETWLDLRTKARYTVFPTSNRAHPQVGMITRRAWYNGKRTYRVEWPGPVSSRDPRTLIMRTVRRRGEKIPAATRITPIDKLRELLAAAGRGEATLEEAAPARGVPVVKVTVREPVDAGVRVESTWMTRERTPRQLRSFETVEYSAAHLREQSPRVRRQLARLKGITVSYDLWELLPRTPENIAKVQPPDFDPKRYKLSTQFLGPPKR